MPRRQRFKPSRKPKPAIEPEQDQLIGSTEILPTLENQSAMREERHADEAEDRVPR